MMERNLAPSGSTHIGKEHHVQILPTQFFTPPERHTR